MTGGKMIAALIPQFSFVVAIGASLLLPLLLLLFSRLAPKGGNPKHSLLAAIAFAPILAVGMSMTFFDIQSELSVTAPSDAIAALLLYVTAVMIVYSAWSLIGYGFTLSVLNAACSFDEPASVEQLAERFGGGHGLRAFLGDRMGVLLGMGLMVRSGNHCELSGCFSVRFAAAVRLAMRVYAIRAREGK